MKGLLVVNYLFTLVAAVAVTMATSALPALAFVIRPTAPRVLHAERTFSSNNRRSSEAGLGHFTIPAQTCAVRQQSPISSYYSQSRRRFPPSSPHSSSSIIVRHMYNLPPSGGGGGGGGGPKVTDLLPGILTILGLTLFFFSPLGGIFFAITNSLFALALITPFVLLVAFQVWQFFNTVQGPCPNCGASIRVLKDKEGMSPTFCLNCGAVVKSNKRGDGIELFTGSSVDDVLLEEDAVFGNMLNDLWGTGSTYDRKQMEKKRQDQARRERTVIDVDVEDD